VSVLIGSTGFVGGHLQTGHEFAYKFHRPNIGEAKNLETDLLICAGLPAEKWKANKDPIADWENTFQLAQVLTKVKAERAVLISSIDVYQPAINVTERDAPSYNGEGAYGRNRAWFETFFTSNFPDSHVIRLPGLFAKDLKKNLIFDLMNRRSDQLANINKDSLFQFFDISKIWDILNICFDSNLSLLNLATEPVSAQEIAELFDVKLNDSGVRNYYDMRSIHAEKFSGIDGYIRSKDEILHEISLLKK
jgi:hypothetical protein